MYIASEGKVNMLTSGFIVGNHTAYSIFLWVTNSKSIFFGPKYSSLFMEICYSSFLFW